MSRFGKIDQNVVGSHTGPEWEERVREQGFLCFYCGIPICEGSRDPNCELTKDHLLPFSLGGVDYIWNVVAACFRCNSLKGASLPGQFLQRLGRIPQTVNDEAQISTGVISLRGDVLPFHKHRDPQPEEELDEFGNLVADHIAVSPFAAGMVRYLSGKKMMEKPDEWYAQRRRLLKNQAITIVKLSLERAGQMTLPFDAPKPVASALLETEPQSLVFHGYEVRSEAFR